MAPPTRCTQSASSFGRETDFNPGGHHETQERGDPRRIEIASTLAVAGPAAAAPIVTEASGPSAASIQPAVDAFRGVGAEFSTPRRVAVGELAGGNGCNRIQVNLGVTDDLSDDVLAVTPGQDWPPRTSITPINSETPGRMAVIVCNVQPNFSDNPLPTQLKWIAFDV